MKFNLIRAYSSRIHGVNWYYVRSKMVRIEFWTYFKYHKKESMVGLPYQS